MAYVICEPCVDEKATACTKVCPVDAIHPLPTEPQFSVVDQLFIDPETCIDCGLCLEACPVGAIYAQADVPADWSDYIQKNADYYGL